MLKLHKRMQSGFTIIELLIVIAIIGILATLVLTNFQGAQAKGRDVTRKSDINSIYNKLEEYHNENGGYPDGLLSNEVLPGIDEGALVDADGEDLVYTGGFITTTTAPTLSTSNTGDNEYIYAAYACTTATAQDPVGSTCAKYRLETFLEKDETNEFIKNSLN